MSKNNIILCVIILVPAWSCGTETCRLTAVPSSSRVRQLGNDTTTTLLGNYIRARFRYNWVTTSDARTAQYNAPVDPRESTEGAQLGQRHQFRFRQFGSTSCSMQQHRRQQISTASGAGAGAGAVAAATTAAIPSSNNETSPTTTRGDGQPRPKAIAGTHLHLTNHNNTTTTTNFAVASVQCPGGPQGGHRGDKDNWAMT